MCRAWGKAVAQAELAVHQEATGQRGEDVAGRVAEHASSLCSAGGNEAEAIGLYLVAAAGWLIGNEGEKVSSGDKGHAAAITVASLVMSAVAPAGSGCMACHPGQAK